MSIFIYWEAESKCEREGNTSSTGSCPKAQQQELGKQVSHLGGSGPSTAATLYCFPGRLVRKLDQKQGDLGFTQKPSRGVGSPRGPTRTLGQQHPPLRVDILIQKPATRGRYAAQCGEPGLQCGLHLHPSLQLISTPGRYGDGSSTPTLPPTCKTPSPSWPHRDLSKHLGCKPADGRVLSSCPCLSNPNNETPTLNPSQGMLFHHRTHSVNLQI